MIYVASQRDVAHTVGGVEVFIRRLRQGFPHIQVVQPCDDFLDPEEAIRLPLPNVRPRTLAFAVGLWWWAVRHRSEISVLVVNRVEVALAAILSGNRKRTVVVVHGSSAYAPLYFSLGGQLVQAMSEWLAVRLCREVCVLMGESEYGLPYYRAKYPNATNIVGRSVIIPQMPPLVAVHEPDDLLRLAYLGRLDEPVKRITALAYLSRRLDDQGVRHRIDVFGEGADEQRLIRTALDLGVLQNLRISRVADATDLPREFHVGIIASRFEGMCMAALELLAAGVPLVVTDVGDMRLHAQTGAVKIVEGSARDSSRQCGAALAAGVTAVMRDWADYRDRAMSARELIGNRWHARALEEWELSLRG